MRHSSGLRYRWYAAALAAKLRRPFVHLLFGARQTGKSTLIRSLLPPDAVIIDLSSAAERITYAARPDLFEARCRALDRASRGRYVFVDEVQTVPAIFDSVQHLYDADRVRWRFILCGSSMRTLRRLRANLLPGRSFLHHLHPLVLAEQPAEVDHPSAPLIFPLAGPRRRTGKPFPAWPIEARLAWGALPGVVAAPERDRADLLRAYSAVHLEEEIRRESQVKDMGSFLRFLQLAASESGRLVNFAAISREAGVSIPTVKSHFQLLEDMHAGFTVPAWSGSTRKDILSTPRWIMFDLGVRHAAAGLTPSIDTVRADPGPFFEQWVGLELHRRLGYLGTGMLRYFRTKGGVEVDYVVDLPGRTIPIEVKWTERPALSDARHLAAFIAEHGKVKEGFLICRCPHPLRLSDRITAIPWWRM